ncbi:hypothetical protein AZE42_05301 [Rhizopogon vesiculosus]|uniref:Uncharacterized protein n=1 Tax=Rhizopogon vesiculosus TaxID=180088 RepID=A0A1J8QXQ5_9AGAM|nr:hypothetical protein AZE42_05301 [Rhizopogon vesiculosus]
MSTVVDDVVADEPVSTVQPMHDDLNTLEISGKSATDEEVVDGAANGVKEVAVGAGNVLGAGHNDDDSSVTASSDDTLAAEASVEVLNVSKLVNDEEPEAPVPHTGDLDNDNTIIIEDSEPPASGEIKSPYAEAFEQPTTSKIPTGDISVALAEPTQEDANEVADIAISEITKDEIPAIDDSEAQTPPIDTDTTIVDAPEASAEDGEPPISSNMGPDSAISDAVKLSINGVGSTTDAELSLSQETPTRDPSIGINKFAEVLEEVIATAVETQEIPPVAVDPAVVEDTSGPSEEETSQLELEVSPAEERPVVPELVASVAPAADTASEDTPIPAEAKPALVEAELAGIEATSSLGEPETAATVPVDIDSTAHGAAMEETSVITEPEPEPTLQLTKEAAEFEPSEETPTLEPSIAAAELDPAEETAPVAEAVLSAAELADTPGADTDELAAEFIAPVAEEEKVEEPKGAIEAEDQPAASTESGEDTFAPEVVSAPAEATTDAVVAPTQPEEAIITADTELQVPAEAFVAAEAEPVAANDTITVEPAQLAVADPEPVPTTETDPIAVAEPAAAGEAEAENTVVETVPIDVEPPSSNTSFVEDPEVDFGLVGEEPQTPLTEETATLVLDESSLESADEESEPQEAVEESAVEETVPVEVVVSVDPTSLIREPASIEEAAPAEESPLEETVQVGEVVLVSTEELAPLVDAAPVEGVAPVEAVEELAPVEETTATSIEPAAPIESTPAVEEAVVEESESIVEDPTARADELEAPVVEEILTSVEAAGGEESLHIVDVALPTEQPAALTEESTVIPEAVAPVTEEILTAEEKLPPTVEVVAALVEEDAPVVEEPSAPAPFEDIPVVEEATAPALVEEDISVVEEPYAPTSVEEGVPVVEEPSAPAPAEEDFPVVEEPSASTPVEEDNLVVEEPSPPLLVEEVVPIVEEPAVPVLVEEDVLVVEEPFVPVPVEEDISVVEEPSPSVPVEEDIPVVEEASVPVPVEEIIPVVEGSLAPAGADEPEPVSLEDAPAPVEECEPVAVEETPVPEEQPVAVEETSATAEKYHVADEMDEIPVPETPSDTDQPALEAPPATEESPIPDEEPTSTLHEPSATEVLPTPVDPAVLEKTISTAEGTTPVFEAAPVIPADSMLEAASSVEQTAIVAEVEYDAHVAEPSMVVEESAPAESEVPVIEKVAEDLHAVVNPTALAETSGEIEETGAVEQAVGEVAEQQELATITALSIAADIERPKSPWTPSYSVTTQGSNIPVDDEPGSTYEGEDDIEPTHAQTPEIIIEEVAAIVPEIAANVELARQSQDDADVAVQSAELEAALGEVEEAHLKSPWTPSYSVTVQGHVAQSDEGLEDLEQLPPSAAHSVEADEVEEQPVSSAEGALVAGEISTSTEVIADAHALFSQTVNDTMEYVIPDPAIEVEAPQHIPSEQVATTVEAEPLIVISPEAAIAEEELEEEIEQGSFIVEDESVQLSTPESAEERSQSPWTPSYSVTGLEPTPALDNQVVANEGEFVEHGSFILETQSADVTEDAPEAKLELLTPVDDPVGERPKSPWTPSYSVTKQGPTEEMEELDELEQLPDLLAGTPALAADEKPVPPILITETRASVDEHVVTEEAAAAQEVPQVFPILEVSQKISKKPSLSAVDELNAASTTDVSQFTTLRIDIPATNEDSRKRLESTTSSRFFPGGWFSSSPKVPEEGRASLDVAAGEFVQQTSVENTPTTALPSAVEEDREKKSRWCTIM